MPRFSISILTSREVVVNAKDLARATKKALRYARDVFPSISSPVVQSSTPVPPSHTSRTSDDCDDIPRDA